MTRHVTVIGSDAVKLLIAKVQTFTSSKEASEEAVGYMVSRLHKDLKEILPGEENFPTRQRVITLVVDQALGITPLQEDPEIQIVQLSK